jgi:hypothetical protein
MRTKLHVPGDNLIVEALLSFEVKQSVMVRNGGTVQLGYGYRYLLSPFDTNPMLSKGSCLTGLSLSHGAEVFRLSEPLVEGPLAIVAAIRSTVALSL